MQGIERRMIWFEPPERALANPIRFMAYAMTSDSPRYECPTAVCSDEDFRALAQAPPGIIDPRSWAYWHLKMGHYPPPPLPHRRLG